MSRFLTSRFQDIAPYTPGEQPVGNKLIKLNTNESPYPPAPGVEEAVRQSVSSLNLYPELSCNTVLDPLSQFLGVEKDQLFIANGSDEVLALCFWGLCPQGAAFADITYGFYQVYGKMYGVDCRIVPLEVDFTEKPMAFTGLGRTIFIASPNSPTGLTMRLEDIESLLQWNPGNLVVVDEAYISFGGKTAVPLLSKYDNLLVVGTFSKSRSLAGARLGYAVGNCDIISDLERMRFGFNPYNVNTMTLAAAAASLNDQAYYETSVKRVVQTREKTQEALAELGFEYTQSQANFMFITHPAHSAEFLFQRLREEGVLVRWFKAPRIDNYLRVSVGSEDEMEQFVEAVSRILQASQ